MPGNVQTGYYYEQNGVFEKVVGDRPARQPFTGNLRPFTDNSSKVVAVIEDWNGEMMPINGVTDEEKIANNEKVQTGIRLMVKNQRQNGLYTLDGRYVNENCVKPGLYLRSVDGRTFKTIIR